MFYYVFVILTMLVLPLVSMAVEHGANNSWLWLAGKWFVFWAVGLRLGAAGVRQYLQPGFTSRDILGIETPGVHPVVRELGGANFAAGLVGLLSLAFPSFVLPSAISAGVFYAVAAVEHGKSEHRGAKETVAYVTDIFAAVVLLGFAAAALATGQS